MTLSANSQEQVDFTVKTDGQTSDRTDACVPGTSLGSTHDLIESRLDA
jgi:hypothetical protein